MKGNFKRLDTDRNWEYYGKNDPYYGVSTSSRFRRENINEHSLREFFESGQQYVNFVLSVVREHVDANFKPSRSLDFGCGVGRLTLALASVSDFVTGVDVSEPMLSEARKNTERRSVGNAEFRRMDSDLSTLHGQYDLVNSFIVLQHIPKKRGELLFRELVKLLKDGGVGVLHLTYCNINSTSAVNRTKVAAREMAGQVFDRLPIVFRIWNVIKRRPFHHSLGRTSKKPEPPMPPMLMENYDLNCVFRIMQEENCHSVHTRFTNHSGHLGVILFFQKKSLKMW
jgi:2-polyprenyl-3-methyl-5-hydroxy-6-metoxy-1,4-benzoquinol methylase